MKLLRLSVFALLTLMLLGVCSGEGKAKSAAAEPVVCRLAYTAKVHYAPQILGLKKGWFAAPSITVQGVDLGMSAGIAAAEALVSGSADVSVMGDVPAIFALASQRPCVLIASYGGGETMHSIITNDASGIARAEDLAGKRIGVQFGSSTHGAVYLYLRANQIDQNSVTLVNIPQSSLIEALISKDIDALAASEPTPSLALEKVPGSRLLAILSGLGNDYPLMMVASKEFAEAHPKVINALLDGTRRAVDFINSDPEKAGEELSASTGTPVALEVDTLRKLIWGVRLDEGIISSLEQTADFLHSVGRLQSIPDIRAMTWMESVD
ncbi:MAG: ABC transporter substrate-binding protein [Desulfomonilia bacterium]